MNNRFVTAVTGGRAASWAATVGLLLGLSATGAAAQRMIVEPEARKSEDPSVPDLAPRRKSFSLFAQADAAASGVNMTGTYSQAQTNYGLCGDQGALINGGNFCVVSVRKRDGAILGRTFGLQFTAGVPRSEFRKIRALRPEAAAARGNGYSAIINIEEIAAGPYDFGPKDATLGQLFAGATSTRGDGSCLDQFNRSNGYVLSGVSLLARSDCPATWAAGGFDGPRPIPDSAYIRAFNADPNNFTFDFFRIPASERNNTRFLGNTSTYGEISDHYAEQAALYGGVTQLGTGSPQISGFPLGLEMHFEAFSVALPTVANAQFYQMTVVNRSADVYGGAGIDYDSLYMGMTFSSMNPGPSGNTYIVPGGRPASAVGGARDLPTYLIDAGNNSSSTAGCNGAYVDGSTGPCPSVGAISNNFDYGGSHGVMFLKSPIGDMRNKLLTRPGSPFFNPLSTFRDDTITINHGHLCGYGGCALNTWTVSERSGFGMMSSTEENVLDGRNPSDITGFAPLWRIFRNETWPVFQPKFTRYVPGNWDYNNDGVQDTLSFTTCSTRGCVRTFADTLPGRQINRYGNAMSPMTAGPFKFKAGDTTSFVFAFFGGNDSTSVEAIVDNAYKFYMDFYLGPEAPPVPAIASTEVGIASVQDALGQDPYVRLYLGPGPDDFVDPFLANFASQVRSGAAFAKIRNLNPNLVGQLEGRSKQNFLQLLVFKSCDNGRSFTGDADCVGDPSIGLNGLANGPGFLPYATINADSATGNFEKVFTDLNVAPGRTYLYSLVTRSRGFTATIRDVDPTDLRPTCQADSTAAACRQIARVFTVADTLISTLPTSGPSTAKVYVPISVAAGTSTARFVSTSRTFVTPTDSMTLPGATIPVFVRFGQNVQPGRYRLIFGNRFDYTTTTNRATGAVTTSVRVQDVITGRTGSETVAGPRVISDTTLFGNKPIVVGDSAGVTANTLVQGGDTPSTDDDLTIVTDTISKFGFVFVSPTGEPLFISTDLRPDGTTPNAFIAGANSTGFVVRFDQNAASATRGLTLEALVKANGDTVQRGILDAAAVQQLESSTSRVRSSGNFEVRFSGDAFGPAAPFTIDFNNPPATEAAVNASLEARPVADTSVYSAEIFAKIVRDVPSLDEETLVKADFPFVLYNNSFGSKLILAKLRSSSATSTDAGVTFSQTLLLGNTLNDTLRITVPEDKWLPGDRIVALQVVQRDSTVGSATILDGASGVPIQVTDTVVAFGPLVLGCNTPRSTCNPVALRTLGATGYRPYEQGDKLVLNYVTPFGLRSTVTLDITGAAPSSTRLSNADLQNVRVVPNPYIFSSVYDQVDGDRNPTSQVNFTGVPESGVLRVYSVSGQFIQELRWTAADLNGTGDLPYNLRSREGTDLASGLYIFVINTNAGGSKQTARGKFVVIR